MISSRQPYHPAAQDRFFTEAKQGWAGQYLNGRPPGKTRMLLEEVLVRPAGGALLTLWSVWVLMPQYSDETLYCKKHRPSDETLNRGPDSVVIKNPRMSFEKRRGVTGIMA